MSIKNYSYNDKTQLSKNFNVSEFKCKCGKNHDIKISTELISKLQELTDLVSADYVVISSGYRCSTHDKNVGGSGSGPHVDGYAADCSFYKNGKIINTKLLSCVAQDLGFNGIANITSDYSWIHLDMKNRIYKGNEIINYNTLTQDFYSYYGISKSEVNKLIGKSEEPINTNNISNSNNYSWSNTYDYKVKELQQILKNKDYNIKVDGYAGPETYSYIKNFSIDVNSKGDIVKWVQERLNNMGFNCGIADGICGSNTMKGINTFQKENNLGQGYLGGTDWVILLGGTINK